MLSPYSPSPSNKSKLITTMVEEEDSQSSFSEGSSKHQLSSSVGSSGGTTATGDETAYPKFVAKDNQNICFSRAVFLVLLILLAATAGAVTYLLLSRDEENDFEAQFFNLVNEVDAAIQRNADIQANFIETFEVALTNQAKLTNTTWPKFVVPEFAPQAQAYRQATKADFVAISPFVTKWTLESWETFSVENSEWWHQGLQFEGRATSGDELKGITPMVSPAHVDKAPNRMLPLWQMSPVQINTLVNYNLMNISLFRDSLAVIEASGAPVISKVVDTSILSAVDILDDHPRSFTIAPIFDELTGQKEAVAMLITSISWEAFFSSAVHEGANGLILVVTNDCGDVFTYKLFGHDAFFLGYGDLHDQKFNGTTASIPFAPFELMHLDDHGDHVHADEDGEQAFMGTSDCHYNVAIYPSEEIMREHVTNQPVAITATVVLIFAVVSILFLAYDRLVQRRQNKVMDSAIKSNAIVSSLFPADVRRRLEKSLKSKETTKKSIIAEGAKFRLKSFLNDDATGRASRSEETDDFVIEPDAPIADLFPHTTVMFADIAGFTAWSSVREPTQVFTLLETVYNAFDLIAKKRRVFKVETIGDCYVAVAGLPEPREDHAVVMARFARDCLKKMGEITKRLEVLLGPETGELEMRIGLHSGAVTAGVLRGEKSRFQLFGDTVNTAARMESTSRNNRIQCSQDTADELRSRDKGRWLKAREDTVIAKGKGAMQTFWVMNEKDERTNSGDLGLNPPIRETTVDGTDVSDRSVVIEIARQAAKNKRLAVWTTELLSTMLKQLVASRRIHRHSKKDKDDLAALEERIGGDGRTILEEVPAFVPLPKFYDEVVVREAANVELGPKVQKQLALYVETIAGMYQSGNAFHNFEHCAHVTMSVRKMLGRVVSPENPIHNGQQVDLRLSSDDRTYGITSDKMAQFASVFAALIHDVDHQGVPNFVLAQEDEAMKTRYKGRSLAEQNSVELAWEALMGPAFVDLRACIYTNKDELCRFRELIVNTVMATDIFDPELAKNRRERWQRAFEQGAPESHRTLDDVSRKATIVFEHLIQASDVAHTMQHWKIYQKWNERLFREMYTAYKEGRMPKDPSLNWYQGELSFFDHYVIPLAKKLEVCGVFGVSSDECLIYAVQNRAEWCEKGEQLVEQYLERIEAGGESSHHDSSEASLQVEASQIALAHRGDEQV